MMINTWIRGLFKRSTASNSSDSEVTWSLDTERYSIANMHDNFEIRSLGEYDRELKTLGKTDPQLLNWIGSISWSGYTREECLRYLVKNYTEGDENRILLRLADWVTQVYIVAEEWTFSHFEELSWESIKSNDRLIVYLSRKEHLIDSSVMDYIKNVIISKSKEVGQKSFYELNPLLRRLLYFTSLDGNQSLRGWIINDSEPFNRLLLLTAPYRDNLTHIEEAAFNADESVFIRRKYLKMILEQGRMPDKNDLLRYALDKNQGLRASARFYLNKFYSTDTYEFYKRQEGIAAYYISDFAKQGDADFFVQGVENPDRKIRLLCLKAIVRIDPLLLKEIDTEKLILENRKVRKIIVPLLPRFYALNELLNLRDVLERSSPHGKFLFFNLIEKKSFWVFVNIVLEELIETPSDRFYAYILNAVLGKVNIYESLSDELAHDIRNKMNSLKSMNEKRYAQLIEWIAFSTRSIAG